jgi:serine/threonine protein kinase
MNRAPGVIVGRSQQVVRPGTVIAGKYRVEKELGRGGFGIVVRAVHLAIDQVVAIKILTTGDGGENEWREDAARFKREAQATAALRSEHVVRILDVDVLESGAPYIVMEYLEGETLHHILHTRNLSVAEAVDTIVQILEALGEAHAAGIVHRDLKPANVLVVRGAGGTPIAKVLDFGVSKIAAQSGIGTIGAGSQPITKTGAIIGTIAYMAPEQMVDAKRVDARADLWSVGIMLFELFTKQTPFGSSSSPTLVSQMLTMPPMSLLAMRPDLPPRLERVVLHCLEKLPERRYSTAASVGRALSELVSPRGRPALESLRRAGKPTGAAAPAEKGALKGPGPNAARGRPPGAPASPSEVSNTALAIAMVGALVTVALIALAVWVVMKR